MSLTRSGDDPARLLAALGAWSDGSVAHDVAVSLAQRAQVLVRDTFAASRAPDGSRWRPLKHPRPGGSVLVRRGQLAAAAARYTVDRGGFVFDAAPDFAKYHQSEDPRKGPLPRRPFYPDDAALPVWWSLSLESAADDAAREYLP